MRKLLLALLASFAIGAFAQVSIIPNASTSAVTVGSGFVKSQTRQVVRTATNKVYIFAVDDSPCLSTGGTSAAILRAYKGAGAQGANANVPTSFAEVDSAHHPVGVGTASCQFNGGVTSMVFTPDVRMDASGLIHLAYISPQTSSSGNVYYQTFDPSTDLWGTRTQLATNGNVCGGGSWPRWGNVALSLDASDHPYVTWATSASCSLSFTNDIQWEAKTASGGTAWTTAASITGTSGTCELYLGMSTAADGTLHLVWQDSSLSANANIKWVKYSGASWGTVETVATGTLAAGDDDQSPSVVIDSSNLPHVLYMVGTASPTISDNFIRLKYRSAGGAWTDDTPPSSSGGSPSATGTWGGVAHTPTNYISALGTEFIFLGHDSNKSPIPYESQTGVGTSWSAQVQADPCNTTTSPSGEPGCDGSADARWDVLRDNNKGLVDILYFKEDDGTAGFNHHGTIFYKALSIPAPAQGNPIFPSLLFASLRKVRP